MQAHKYAKLIPDMSPADYARLENDIEANGLREPIVTYQGKILDGRHRFKACKATKTEPEFWEYDGDDPIGFVWSANGDSVHRGRLTSRFHGLRTKSAILPLSIERIRLRESRRKLPRRTERRVSGLVAAKVRAAMRLKPDMLSQRAQEPI